MAPGGVLQPARGNRGGVPAQGLAVLHRRANPDPQVAGAGRPGSVHDRDRGERNADARRPRRRRGRGRQRAPARRPRRRTRAPRGRAAGQGGAPGRLGAGRQRTAPTTSTMTFRSEGPASQEWSVARDSLQVDGLCARALRGRRCDDSDRAPLIGAKWPHAQPPCTNNPASRLMRRGLLGR